MSIELPRPADTPPEPIQPLLQAWGLRDLERGQSNLAHLSRTIEPAVLQSLLPVMSRVLPDCPDPDMALNNFERYLRNPDAARQVSLLLEQQARGLETLLQLLSTSQYLSDVLVNHPDYVDRMHVPLHQSPDPAELRRQLHGEVAGAFEDAAVLRAFRRFRQRQILRIGTNDIIRDRPLEEITRDISLVADAAIGVALATALRSVGSRFGSPVDAGGSEPVECAVLAFGKLGGEELNYSSDIDLMFVYAEEGATHGGPRGSISNAEFFGRVVSEVVRLLSAHTPDGQAYRVDLRLRPEGHQGPLARSLESTLQYYDAFGRTWERQALIKVRPVAGNRVLAEAFLKAIEPWVYRKYLSFSEINEIKLLKRRIEQKAGRAGISDRDVKTGHGGIRDIEFAIQFLQLLNASDLPELRQRSTLLAMRALEAAGCLTDQEYHILEDAYRYLRKTEHRLQLLFDLQVHQLPEGKDELHKLALRMGYQSDPLNSFLRDYREKTALDRKILDHLLHETFTEPGGQAEPETDLILDPDPDAETIRSVLGRYRFRDVQAAYHNLIQLARESVPFLSARRCRHFLASIAPLLLRALAETPDPDMALVNLEKVTASLGAKSVLWELFSFNPPSLKLYVDLCAGSQFLSEILINNPGMVDELLDSLVLNQPRTAEELRAELTELCRGAADPQPILHSFQDKELLRIGVRDLLGKDTIQSTTAALSDLAEVILQQILRWQEPVGQQRLGVPHVAEGSWAGQPSRYVLLGLGKLGGHELSYHSDLDLMWVYEGDGQTIPLHASAGGVEPTTNFHFFSDLAQRVIKALGHRSAMGRLYEVDMRLRPTGKSGSLVIPLTEFQKYYQEGGAQLWERQALTRARIVSGDPEFAQLVQAAVYQAAYGPPWQPEWLDQIIAMRHRLAASRSERDLKRGVGGMVDIEFLVQTMQLKYAQRFPEIRVTNTWEALACLHDVGLLSDTAYTELRHHYDFLRLVEGRLRIVHNRSLDELPERPEDLEKLARQLGCAEDVQGEAGARFLAELDQHTSQTRDWFLRLVEREKSA